MHKRNSQWRRRARVAVWLAIAFTTIAASAYYWYFLRLPSSGTGPAGPSVDRSAFLGSWKTEPVMLLGLGDSVTAGFGASRGKSYFNRLIANPEDEFADLESVSLAAVFPRLETLNVAESGSNSIQCLEKQLPRLKTFPPDLFGVVVVTTGGNDLIHWYGRSEPKEGAMYGASLDEAEPWIDKFSARLDRILYEINERFPGGCEIFLANIYDPSDGIGKPEAIGMPPWDDMIPILGQYNEVIASAAARHSNVHLVDIHAVFLGHGVRSRQPWREHYQPDDPHYWYHENIEDPNDRGYDAIRRAFLNAMAEVFAQS